MQAVQSAADLPPLFDPYWVELEKAHIVVKVPFHVDRREALAGSDLYEKVFALSARSALLLRATGDSVERTDLPYERLTWVSLAIELLDARLTFGDAEGSNLELVFNAVSAPLAREITRMARVRLHNLYPTTEALREREDLASAPLPEEDYHFSNLLREICSSESVYSLLAYQGGGRLRPPSTGRGTFLRGLGDALRPSYIDSLLLLELPGELLVVREGDGPRRGRKGYRLETLWQPTASLLPPQLETHRLPNGAKVSILKIGAIGGGCKLAFASVPEPAITRLKELADASAGLRGPNKC